jgi:hypothetical protein
VSRSLTGATQEPSEGRLRCASCGAFLGGDPEDDPTGDDGRPICGECARERDFDVDLQLMDEDER